MDQGPLGHKDARSSAPEAGLGFKRFGGLLALAGIVGGILAIPAIGVLAVTPLVFGLAGAGLVLGLLSFFKGRHDATKAKQIALLKVGVEVDAPEQEGELTRMKSRLLEMTKDLDSTQKQAVADFLRTPNKGLLMKMSSALGENPKDVTAYFTPCDVAPVRFKSVDIARVAGDDLNATCEVRQEVVKALQEQAASQGLERSHWIREEGRSPTSHGQ